MTCTRAGCDKPTRAAELCEAHYRAAARTGHCTIDDCTAPIYARLRCARHYEQWRGANAVKPRCAVDGCDRPRRARDWCEMHYRRWRKTGTTDEGRMSNVGATCHGPDCQRDAVAKGLCAAHREQQKKGRDLAPIGATVGPYRDGRQVKAKTSPAKPTVKRAKKPKSTLPPGWFKPSPKSSERGNTLTQERVDTLLPLVSVSEAEYAQFKAPVLRLLARHDALDLAEMLGVSS